MKVLHAFRDTKTDLGIAQIADAVGLQPSTTHRIVRALVNEDYLAQDDRTQRYYLSRGAVLLGAAAHRTLGLSAARPVLERIGAHTSESVNLGVPDGTHALVVLRVESPLPLRFDQPPGTRVPLHASSMGKSLLAFGGDLDTYLDAVGGYLPRYTPKTITAIAQLRGETTRVRDRGYSTDYQESITGVHCVGAPILTPEGSARAALAIQAPAVRLSRHRIDDLVDDVLLAAKEIADLLPPEHNL
ncbi:MAG: IclR family transcriptional regulator [Nocardioidaceae bacterium]